MSSVRSRSPAPFFSSGLAARTCATPSSCCALRWQMLVGFEGVGDGRKRPENGRADQPAKLKLVCLGCFSAISSGKGRVLEAPIRGRSSAIVRHPGEQAECRGFGALRLDSCGFAASIADLVSRCRRTAGRVSFRLRLGQVRLAPAAKNGGPLRSRTCHSEHHIRHLPPERFVLDELLVDLGVVFQQRQQDLRQRLVMIDSRCGRHSA